MAVKLIVFFLFSLSFLWGDEDEIVQSVTKNINAIRTDRGLSRLLEEKQLAQSAKRYALELNSLNYLTHKDSAGRGPWERYSEGGGTALAAGEILGTKASGTPVGEIVRAWMESADHKTQILNPRWTCIGVGYVCNDEREIFVVQFTNSLLRDYTLQVSGESLILQFIPLHGEEELIFRTVLGGPAKYLRQDTLAFDEGNLPLFLEISRPGLSTANRIVYP